jgi:7,8-dihydropterin-6-yl-methyl-4-(beta-D-ribofuranosyl)aminobenzene 5'-phosphate synthase
MRILCIVNNEVRSGSPLRGEHGLALTVESGAGTLLWDTGQKGATLLHNMAALQVDLAAIDKVAISHGHADHTGGLRAALTAGERRVEVYAHPNTFRERFSQRAGKNRAIGSPVTRAEVAVRAALHESTEPQEVAPGVWTSGEIAPRPEPEGRGAGHVIRAGEGWAPDPYDDDMSLVIEQGDELALICGCCHAGLLNTIACVEHRFARPITLIAGGTHLMAADPPTLGRVIEALEAKADLRGLYLNHCSGDEATRALRKALGAEVVRPFPAGAEIELEGTQ